MPGEVMEGAWWMRAINKNRDGLFAVEVAAQQLDSIIYFASLKSNISKDLKQACTSTMAAKDDHDKLSICGSGRARDAEDVEIYTDGVIFIGGLLEGYALRDYLRQLMSEVCEITIRRKATRQYSQGQEVVDPEVEGSRFGDSDPDQASWKAGPEKAGQSRIVENKGL